ncbi:hypothetical protein C1646_796863 [Rhizophagus diaphanus]|nr:hypothetical protein C1646_796863 [Rhizophagus diaphanus] [Rhizophagus sp. MUCL 43196]
MSTLLYELINATNNRTFTLCDISIHNDIHKQFEFYNQTVLADKILTNDEKTYAIRLLTKYYDRDKVIDNDGARRICENCNLECLATSYCEYCVRNYLKEDFSNWTSGNDDIDNLIQKCQMETLMPNTVVEWIPYSNLETGWINGNYDEWDSEKKQLTRLGNIKVILKKLENVESANQSWFEEAKSHLTISNKRAEVVQCYDSNEKLSKEFKKLQINSNNVEKEIIQQHVDVSLTDDDEVYNNPNLIIQKNKMNWKFLMIDFKLTF